MALTIDAANKDALSIEEFVDFVGRSIDVRDFDSLCSCAPAFKALINNRSLISDLIERELRSWRDFQSGNSYVGTTLILARTPEFFIRANVWLPDTPRSRTHGDSVIYGLTHDHNFTFMTGGYLGSGYTTEIFERDSEESALPGQRVKLDFLERTTLPAGKIMVYRALRDVHRQSRPEELSVSINLVVPTHTRTRPQYFFDLERCEVLRSEYPEHGRALALFRLAACAGDTRTFELLGDIATGAADAQVRARAYEALCDCAPEVAADLYGRMSADDNPHVRTAVERAALRSQRVGAAFPIQPDQR
jgi:hypothetical protein